MAGEQRDDGARLVPAWATPGRLAWAVLGVALTLVALNVTQAQVFAHHDAPLLDLRLGYGHDEVTALFAAYGPSGRRAYAWALLADSVYPLALCAGVILAAARAFGDRRWLWLAPVAFAVLDLVENALFASMLATFPDPSALLVTVAAPVTVVKLASFPPTVVTGVVALTVLARRRWRDRGSGGRIARPLDPTDPPARPRRASEAV